MKMIGYPLGILIGVITGVVLILLLKLIKQLFDKSQQDKNSQPNPSTYTKIIAEILALPTFWFGGPWVTTQFIQTMKLEEVLDSYLISLTLTFMLIIFKELLGFVNPPTEPVNKAPKRRQK